MSDYFWKPSWREREDDYYSNSMTFSNTNWQNGPKSHDRPIPSVKPEGGKVSEPLKPPASVLIKLGSIAVHVDEFFSPHGHPYDKTATEQLLADPEIKEWCAAMDKMAFLPKKRNP